MYYDSFISQRYDAPPTYSPLSAYMTMPNAYSPGPYMFGPEAYAFMPIQSGQLYGTGPVSPYSNIVASPITSSMSYKMNIFEPMYNIAPTMAERAYNENYLNFIGGGISFGAGAIGAGVGAAVGSAILPGVGTFVGSVIGSAAAQSLPLMKPLTDISVLYRQSAYLGNQIGGIGFSLGDAQQLYSQMIDDSSKQVSFSLNKRVLSFGMLAQSDLLDDGSFSNVSQSFRQMANLLNSLQQVFQNEDLKTIIRSLKQIQAISISDSDIGQISFASGVAAMYRGQRASDYTSSVIQHAVNQESMGGLASTITTALYTTLDAGKSGLKIEGISSGESADFYKSKMEKVFNTVDRMNIYLKNSLSPSQSMILATGLKLEAYNQQYNTHHTIEDLMDNPGLALKVAKENLSEESLKYYMMHKDKAYSFIRSLSKGYIYSFFTKDPSTGFKFLKRALPFEDTTKVLTDIFSSGQLKDWEHSLGDLLQLSPDGMATLSLLHQFSANDTKIAGAFKLGQYNINREKIKAQHISEMGQYSVMGRLKSFFMSSYKKFSDLMGAFMHRTNNLELNVETDTASELMDLIKETDFLQMASFTKKTPSKLPSLLDLNAESSFVKKLPFSSSPMVSGVIGLSKLFDSNYSLKDTIFGMDSEQLNSYSTMLTRLMGDSLIHLSRPAIATMTNFARHLEYGYYRGDLTLGDIFSSSKATVQTISEAISTLKSTTAGHIDTKTGLTSIFASLGNAKGAIDDLSKAMKEVETSGTRLDSAIQQLNVTSDKLKQFKMSLENLAQSVYGMDTISFLSQSKNNPQMHQKAIELMVNKLGISKEEADNVLSLMQKKATAQETARFLYKTSMGGFGAIAKMFNVENMSTEDFTDLREQLSDKKIREQFIKGIARNLGIDENIVSRQVNRLLENDKPIVREQEVLADMKYGLIPGTLATINTSVVETINKLGSSRLTQLHAALHNLDKNTLNKFAEYFSNNIKGYEFDTDKKSGALLNKVIHSTGPYRNIMQIYDELKEAGIDKLNIGGKERTLEEIFSSPQLLKKLDSLGSYGKIVSTVQKQLGYTVDANQALMLGDIFKHTITKDKSGHYHLRTLTDEKEISKMLDVLKKIDPSLNEKKLHTLHDALKAGDYSTVFKTLGIKSIDGTSFMKSFVAKLNGDESMQLDILLGTQINLLKQIAENTASLKELKEKGKGHSIFN